MTLAGWDTSHFDGPISRAVTDRAYAEGIRFLTAKVAEGLSDTEGRQDDSTLANARDSGIPFLAPYFIPRSNAKPADQVAEWMRLLNAGEPWWRDFPGMFVQSDLERWPYDNVPASVGIECTFRIRDAMDRCAILYASRGQYGDQLGAWDGPLWNADYWSPSHYPGDSFTHNDKGAPAGWAPYSGKVPVILQWTSSATIAGLTTCDANAFRGTVADFAAMIRVVGPSIRGGETMGAYVFQLTDAPGAQYLGTPGGGFYAARSPDDFESQNLAPLIPVGPFTRAQAEHIFGPCRDWVPNPGPAGPPGKDGAPGPAGPAGPKGDAAVLTSGDLLRVEVPGA